MKITTNRLFFIDAIRAWAILMMLQGHFIDGLLDPIFREANSTGYTFWLYFRGITAPVFFTVSGFIFTYLLMRSPEQGAKNPRIKKGLKRGLQLIIIGYLLRLNFFGLFKGEIYGGFYLVDVLHCIGLSIIIIIGFYWFSTYKQKVLFPLLLVICTLVLFTFEPFYKQWSWSFMPNAFANYFTKANGSVFTILPWLGYTTIGGALSLFFIRYKQLNYFYPTAIGIAIILGLGLIYFSSPLFTMLFDSTQITLFQLLYSNNYLFIRLGDVFIVFAVFMICRNLLTHTTILKIGSNTLSIYVFHFIILYGSFFGLGLYKFFHHQLNPFWAIFGAFIFMISCTFLALQYNKFENEIKTGLKQLFGLFKGYTQLIFKKILMAIKKLA